MMYVCAREKARTRSNALEEQCGQFGGGDSARKRLDEDFLGQSVDEDDYFAVGDIEVADGDVEHAPVAADGEPCICLAVTEAPLKFSKLFHKAVQPFLNI